MKQEQPRCLYSMWGKQDIHPINSALAVEIIKNGEGKTLSFDTFDNYCFLFSDFCLTFSLFSKRNYCSFLLKIIK